MPYEALNYACPSVCNTLYLLPLLCVFREDYFCQHVYFRGHLMPQMLSMVEGELGREKQKEKETHTHREKKTRRERERKREG